MAFETGCARLKFAVAMFPAGVKSEALPLPSAIQGDRLLSAKLLFDAVCVWFCAALGAVKRSTLNVPVVRCVLGDILELSWQD